MKNHPIWLTRQQTAVVKDALAHASNEACAMAVLFDWDDYVAVEEVFEEFWTQHCCPAPPDDR